MKRGIKLIIFHFYAFLLVFPAGALEASLDGRWISLQYGALSFRQSGASFTAVWTGANAQGSITGRAASFRYWSGASFEACADDSRGYGTLTLSADGNTLSGSWANLSKKEPESGSFTAARMPAISVSTTQDAAPETQAAPGAQTAAPDPLPPGGGSGPETAADPPQYDEPVLTEDLPPEYIGAAAQFLSDIEETVLTLFDIFDVEVPAASPDGLILTDKLPAEYIGPAEQFLSGIEETVLRFLDIFD